jgi:hypothetical protein
MNMQYAAAVLAHESAHRQRINADAPAQQRPAADQRSTTR